jgi:hypothetical protein
MVGIVGMVRIVVMSLMVLMVVLWWYYGGIMVFQGNVHNAKEYRHLFLLLFFLFTRGSGAGLDIPAAFGLLWAAFDLLLVAFDLLWSGTPGPAPLPSQECVKMYEPPAKKRRSWG